MAVAYFHIPLSVKPKAGGEAVLVSPKALLGLSFRFIIVKDGGEEGIVRVEEPEAALKKIEKEKGCKRLTLRQVEAVRKSYPPAKLKSKFQIRTQGPRPPEPAAGSELYEVDEKGNRILDTFQTVRSGFYLIDVPVFPESDDT
jgi:hypothetical protein